MAELVIEQDRVIVRLGRGNLVVVGIVLGIFLLIGAGILGFLIRIWSASGFDPAIIAELVSGADDSIFILVLVFFGLAFAIIPLLVIIGLLSGTKKPREPQALIFDNSARMFRVSDQAWDSSTYAARAPSLPAYSYAELEAFHIRSYTTTSSGDSSSHSTTHHVVCLRKTDGGLWDLHDTVSRSDAEAFLTRIKATVNLGGTASASPLPATPVLPSRLFEVRAGGSTLFCWVKDSHFGGLFLGLAVMAGMFLVMLRVAADFLPFLIFGGIIMAIITGVLVKGFWDGLVSLRYFHCLRLTGREIHVGLLPRSLLPVAGKSPVASQFVPDTVAIDAGFKSQKSLDIRSTRRVQYSWRIADRRSVDQELLLLDEGAAAEMDDLGTGNVRWSTLLKTVGNLRQGLVTLSLSGLSVAETMAFERILEQEIARRGGSAL